MIENFQIYIESGAVREIAPNPQTATSLMERAQARLVYISGQRIGADTAPFIFEDAYEVLREASQALMELEGYKPYSHEAQIAFLRDRCGCSQYLISSFDRLRVLRNKCAYGVAAVSVEACKEAIGAVLSFLPVLKKRFDGKMAERR